MRHVRPQKELREELCQQREDRSKDHEAGKGLVGQRNGKEAMCLERMRSQIPQPGES